MRSTQPHCRHLGPFCSPDVEAPSMSGTGCPASIGEDHATAIQVQRYYDCYSFQSRATRWTRSERSGSSEPAAVRWSKRVRTDG